MRGGGTVATAFGCNPDFRGFESHPPLLGKWKKEIA